MFFHDRRSVIAINAAIIVIRPTANEIDEQLSLQGRGRERAGFTIIIINGAANESCRLNNSCATHDLPVPLSLPLVSFFFPPFFPLPFFFLFFSVNSASANERKYVVQMRGGWGAPRHGGIVTVRIVINQPCVRG